MTAPNDKVAYRFVDAALRFALRRLPNSSVTRKAALSWGYQYRPRPRTVRLRSGLRFNFEGVDYIPLMLYYTGIFEPRLVDYLKRIVRPGDTVLDVGANIGFHTLESWRAVGPGGRVISIEASPAHTAAVRKNLETNGLPAGDVINVAVGDRDGEVDLGLPSGGNLGMFGINAGSEAAFSIPMRRIDDLLASASVSRLSLVKMDIEGSELGALRGAAGTLAKHRPALLIELNDEALGRCDASSADVVGFLNEAGYEGWVIGDDGTRRVRPGMTHDCDECLFLPTEAKELRGRLNLNP